MDGFWKARLAQMDQHDMTAIIIYEIFRYAQVGHEFTKTCSDGHKLARGNGSVVFYSRELEKQQVSIAAAFSCRFQTETMMHASRSTRNRKT